MVNLSDLKKDFKNIPSGNSNVIAESCVFPLLRRIGWNNNTMVIEKYDKSHAATSAYLKVGGEVGLNLVIGKRNDTSQMIQEKLIAKIEDSYNKKIAWTAYSNFENIWLAHTLWDHRKNKDVFWKWNIDQREFFYNIALLKPESFIDGDIDKAEESSLGHNLRILPIDKLFIQKLNSFRESLLNRHGAEFSRRQNLLEFHIHDLFSRLIFVRTCEDRYIVSADNMLLRNIHQRSASRVSQTTALLSKLFGNYRRTFNSELFDKDIYNFDSEIVYNVISFLYKAEDFGYGFNFSKIDVDILGMIYEQYLKKIGKPRESASTQLPLGLEGHYDSTYELSTARKEKGVFFTPQYVVNFIIKHTLKELLEKNNTDFKTPPKVADIACGSGIFLTKAYELLHSHFRTKGISEHEIKRLLPVKSLFAVDIDPKAVLSARLNLWLRYLDKKDHLFRLSKNFIADDSLLAGKNHATLFDDDVREQLISDRGHEILKDETFDVIFGNPPYIHSKYLAKIDPELEQKYRRLYSSAQQNYDLYFLFLEEAIRLTKPGGYIGYIIPNRLLTSEAAKVLKNIILENCNILYVIDFTDQKVFEEADTYSAIIILQKKGEDTEEVKFFKAARINQIRPYTSLQLQQLDENLSKIDVEIMNVPVPDRNKPWLILSLTDESIVKKLLQKDITLPITDFCFFDQGIKTGCDEVFILHMHEQSVAASSDKLIKLVDSRGQVVELERELVYSAVKGKDIKNYQISSNKVVIYPYHNGSLINEGMLKKRFAKVYSYFKQHEEKLRKRKSLSRLPEWGWYGLIWPRSQWVFGSKIMTGDIAFSASFAYDAAGIYLPIGGTAIVPKEVDHLYALTAFLNCKITDWFIQHTSFQFHSGYYAYEQKIMKHIRIPSELFSQENLSFLKNRVDIVNGLIEQLKSDVPLVELSSIKTELDKEKEKIDMFVADLFSLSINELDVIWDYFRKREKLYQKKTLFFYDVDVT